MATAPITTGTPDTEHLADWLSHQVIDFLDDLRTDIECRVEAFAGRISTTLTDAALRSAQASVTTMLAYRGVRDVAGAAETPEQKVLPLASRTSRRAAPPANTPTPPAGGRAPRAPRAGGIAGEITAFLSAHKAEAFTASAMAKSIGDGMRSSGAFDAAAKRMAGRGELVVASEQPRKYTLPTPTR